MEYVITSPGGGASTGQDETANGQEDSADADQSAARAFPADHSERCGRGLQKLHCLPTGDWNTSHQKIYFMIIK